MAGWLVAARLAAGLLSWPWLFRPHAGPQLDNDCGATWPINMCAGRLAFKLAEAGGGVLHTPEPGALSRALILTCLWAQLFSAWCASGRLPL